MDENKVTQKRQTVIETVNGVKYIFSKIAFKEFYQEYLNYRKSVFSGDGKLTKDMIKYEMADAAHVSYETVKNWIKGSTGPSDISCVKAIADYFEIDYKELLVKEMENTINMRRMGQIESYVASTDKDVVIEIYRKILEYINFYVYREIGYDIPNYIETKNVDSLRWFGRHLILEMRHIIDSNALEMSDEKSKKLHTVVTELEYYTSLHDTPIRWQRINESVLDAHLVFDMEFLEDEDEEIAYRNFYDHYFDGFDNGYRVGYEGNEFIGVGGLLEEPTKEQAISIVKNNYRVEEEFDVNKVIVERELPEESIDVDDRALQRNEMVRTIKMIFKEDFSDVINF